jgi:superfamily II RNA helicase
LQSRSKNNRKRRRGGRRDAGNLASDSAHEASSRGQGGNSKSSDSGSYRPFKDGGPTHHKSRRPIRPLGKKRPTTADAVEENTDSLKPGQLKQLEDARRQTQDAIKKWLQASQDLRNQPPVAAPDGQIHLDPWQKQVLEALSAGESVIVDAPTTAGKTRSVEVFFKENISNPLFRAAYTTPVKSLSNDKLREFRAMFGSENVGIATGDIKENLDAPIVVATLESYRNSLLGVEPDLGRTLVVFDEYHYLQDESRGSAWEEAIILTPRTCQLLMLSASVENADEFCKWVESLGEGRTCRLVRTLERPVPLAPLVWHHGGWLMPETLPPQFQKQLDRHLMQLPLSHEQLIDRLATLTQLDLVPCIIYGGKRLACELLATAMCRKLEPLSEAARGRIGQSLEVSQKEFGGLSFLSPKMRQMLQIYGVGYHHSGIAAPARMAIEALVKNGLLRFCAATMGLSLGINFSVRSAVISDYSRPGEQGFVQYSPSEVLQMLGRAGRRGRDAVGFSIWPTPEAFVKLGKTKREAIDSRLRNDPTTFLGLLGRGFSLRAIENFYSKSFRRFCDKNIDLSLITKSRLTKKLGNKELPCHSPAAEFARYRAESSASLCPSCPFKEQCHHILRAKIGVSGNTLSALHLHLHAIGAIDKNESLTLFGQIARFFPQAGGLLMARMIAEGKINTNNIMTATELAAAMALARFKEPGYDTHYRFPFNARELEEDLMKLYPYELFPEVYDPPFGRRNFPVLREFNPNAGSIVNAWSRGMDWKELTALVTTEAFGTGDLMSLMYRTGTYLQSMVQAGIPGLSPIAKASRSALLREPLDFALTV